MKTSFWAYVYRVIVGYDIGIFLWLPIKIFVLKEHAELIEFVNSFFCLIFVFWFWKLCEWHKLFKGNKHG